MIIMNIHSHRLGTILLSALFFLNLNYTFADNLKFKDEGSGLWFTVMDDASRTVEVSASTKTNMPQYPDLSGEIAIPSTVTYNEVNYKVTGIGDHAFFYNKGISKINLPAGITYLDKYCFSGCSALTGLNIPEAVTRIGSYALSSTGLSEIVIPDNTVELGTGAFSENPSLISFEWNPAASASLPDNALMACKAIERITLGKETVKIGYCALSELPALKSLTIYNIMPPALDEYTFDKTVVSDVELNIPAGSLSLYKSAEYWKDLVFGSYNEISSGNTLTAIIVESPKKNISVGEKIQLTAKYVPENTDETGVEWESSNPEIASVNENGLLAGISKGTAVIRARSVHRQNISGMIHIEVASGQEPPVDYVSLQIPVHEGGAAGFRVAKGESAVIELLPEKGYKLKDVFLNGESVLDEVDGLVLTTAPLANDSRLQVVFESYSSVGANSYSQESRLRFGIMGNSVSVNGLMEGESLDIFNLNGMKNGSLAADGLIELENGIYMLRHRKASGEINTFKLIL